MTVLCLDTSSATRVALVDGGRVLARAENPSARHHAESITPLVRRILEEATGSSDVAGVDLEFVAVGTGPAPFTGLRAGLVSARVIAEVAGVPVHGVCSLDVLARQTLDLLDPTSTVVAVADARRREVYWGRYRAEGPDDVTCLEGPEVSAASRVANGLGDSLLVSEGTLPAHAVDALAGASAGPSAPLDVAVMERIVRARLARGGEDRLSLEPLYLRRPDIHGRAPERM